MEWISVKDRLPEPGQHCLIYYAGKPFGDCGKPAIHILKSHEDEAFDKEDAEKWNRKMLGMTGASLYDWHGFRVDCQPYITHWMPLPEPPKSTLKGE